MEGMGVRQKSSRNAAITALFRIHSRCGAESRQAIESTLQRLNGGDLVPVLLESFDPQDPVLAEALVVLLDIIGDKRSVEIFLQAFVNERLSGVALKALRHLGPEIEGMTGRQLRMRMVTIEPGGVFGPIHDHKDRPGTVYVLHP